MSRLLFLPITAVAAVVAFSMLACSGEDSGAAPKVRDLSLTPTELAVGKATILDGNVTVDDADGDIEALSGQLRLPNGTTQELQTTKIAAGSATSAPVLLKVQVLLPAAGEYSLLLWAVDRAGNESAKLEQKLTAK